MHIRRFVFVVSLGAAATAPAFAQTPVNVDCDVPRGLAERRGCEVARQGVEPLRRFAQATRHIYALHLPEYLLTAYKAEAAKGAAAKPEDTKVAEAK